mgnify:CR=1 FL=1
MENKQQKFATRAVHAGQHPDKVSGALVAPMTLTSTFVFNEEKLERYLSGDKEGIYIYGRSRNPTQESFEKKIASLENAEAALATASGMAAITVSVLTAAKSGDHIISCRTVYGGTYTLFTEILPQFNIEVTFLPEMTVEALEAAKRPNTKAVYLETVLNPTLEVLDMDPVFEWAKANGIMSFVDNTFTTPYLYRPLDHGADVVVHSTTKYLNGHGDHIGGAVATNMAFKEKIRGGLYSEFGPAPSPFACWLGLRGMKTLALRMRQHCENGMKLAQYLETHPKVEKVVYPGLPSHPQHELAKKQFTDGYGGMIGLYVKGGVEEAKKVLYNFDMAYLAVSLGDLDTLVEQPATMTHGKVPKEEREKMDLYDNFIRISVGIEDIEDLIADFDKALSAI